MCKFYSAIVMRNGDILHDEHLMSHEDIIGLYNINDSQINCNKFVRVEYTPDESKDFPDISKYKLNVDEDSAPDWFEQHREHVIERLKSFVEKRIITTDRKILTGGLYVVKDCHIDKLISAQVIYLQGQVNRMWGNSQVNQMWGNSLVNRMMGNSQVNEMWENSQVNQMWGNSQVNQMWENSQVNRMRENSQVNQMRENSQVNEMWGNSQVNEMCGNSQVKINNSKNKLPR